MSIHRIAKSTKDTSDGGVETSTTSLSKFFTFLLLIIIFFRLGYYLHSHPTSFQKFHPEAYQRAYLGSTYVQKGGAPISDYIVYSWAAWEYLHGKNPTLINPEMPPLGKYLIGLSLLIFQRAVIGSVLFGLFSLGLVFLIGKIILRSTTLSLIPVALLAFEPIFLGQLDTALLDIYHLFFILLAFWFFLLAQKKGPPAGEAGKFFILASLALGGVMAVKFYSTGLVIALAWIIFLVLSKNYQGLKQLLIALPLALLVLMASYFKIFLEGESLRRFFGIQKWMWHFHSSGKFLVPPGAIWQLIFLKKWITWWGDRRPLPAPDWQITWPLSVAISLGLGALLLVKPSFARSTKDTCEVAGWRSKLRPKATTPRRWRERKVLLIWIIIYLASLSFGIVYPRYLLPLLPFTYIISVSVCSSISTALKPIRGIKKVK